MKTKQHRTLFISHGGGPLPLLGEPSHREMVSALKGISAEFVKPSAILLISAHWEKEQPTITGKPQPGLFYDYYGFPQEAYDITYPAAGEPLLAQQVFNLLDSRGLAPVMDHSRDFDHGMFIPLKIMYPKADIPCVQLSLVQTLDPALHIQIGEALAGLQYENLLIIGSGFSFHNMNAFFAAENAQDKKKNDAFETWLTRTCTSKELDEICRKQLLIDWEKAPHARYCHPREEHLLPLHVCYGANACASTQFLQLKILGKNASFYLW
jgi:aromatic ring-opening dioxygenase catalytic subunit (LigB family)